MADYDKYIGGNTTLRIRDTGSVVEFWVKTGSSTFNNDQDWSRKVDGNFVRVSTYNLASGGNWQKMGQATATYSQTVYFTIYDEGLGFPTYTHSAAITRAGTPDAPSAPNVTRHTDGRGVTVSFTSGDDNNSPLDGRRVGYSSTSDQPYVWVNLPISGGTAEIDGLDPGKTYYFWAQTHNHFGYSPYSARSSSKMYDYPSAPTAATFGDINQTDITVYGHATDSDGLPWLEHEVSWGTSPTTSTSARTTDGSELITGLLPGVTYYFWHRSRTAVGWSAYSPRASATTIAGAWVDVDGVKKKAIPYVRVSGVWKMARPWTKDAGTWKETVT